MAKKQQKEPEKIEEPVKEIEKPADKLCLFEEGDAVCLPMKRGAVIETEKLCDLCIKFKAMRNSDSSKMFKAFEPILRQMGGTVGQLTGNHFVGVPEELGMADIPLSMIDESFAGFMETSDDDMKEGMLRSLKKYTPEKPTTTQGKIAKRHLELLTEWKAKKDWLAKNSTDATGKDADPKT